MISQKQRSYDFMLLPAVVLVLIFSYGPMVGIVIAFQKYNPALGFFRSPFTGLDNFRYLLLLPDTFQILWNTFYIAVLKIIGNFIIPITVALLLNEVANRHSKKAIQTIIYFPHFLSWVILSGVFIDILSPSTGIINIILQHLGIKPVFFLGSPEWFPWILVITEIWKEFGFTVVIYLAALSGIDPSYYEAAVIDGATRWQQTWHVTLPSIMSTIIIMGTLSLGNILNAGFEQVFNLYSPIVYKTGDIIDTFVYRIGLLDAQYGVATAVGLFKSVVSCTLIVISYRLADKLADYRIF